MTTSRLARQLDVPRIPRVTTSACGERQCRRLASLARPYVRFAPLFDITRGASSVSTSETSEPPSKPSA